MKEFSYYFLCFPFADGKTARVLDLLRCLLLLSTLGAAQVYGVCTTYSYDPLNRLSQVMYSDRSIITYTYDAAGNRLGATTTGAAGTAPQFTSTNKTTFIAGLAGRFNVAATGNPAPGFSATGLPPWASLNPTNGLVSGTAPSTNGAPFTVNLTATNGVLPNATQAFTLSVVNVNLSLANRTGNQFEMDVSGIAGQSYTVQTTTNLEPANWFTFLVTNPPSATFQVIDPNATNRTRYYRVLVGP